jgi:hypothetical protein
MARQAIANRWHLIGESIIPPHAQTSPDGGGLVVAAVASGSTEETDGADM